MNNNTIELVEHIGDDESERIKSIVIDGKNAICMIDHLIESRGQMTANHIMNNAKNALSFFANPENTKSNSKILCLGKVQSGKTAFFISTISLAFDNGYSLCFLFGGTKNNLLDQNVDRLSKDFANNDHVKIIILKDTSENEIKNLLSKGYKVIVVVLKNVSSTQSNLYCAVDYATTFCNVPTLIIDDESDEHTPGAPILKNKNPRAGITHDVITEILNLFRNVTMMFVTATPQANLLLSTLDTLSPNYIVLVEPGEDYTGGDAFHDLMTNEHVQVIKDSDDFKSSIPESYKRALKYFMLGVSIRYILGHDEPYSMLIHPSHLTRVHKNIVEKITIDLEELKEILMNPKNVIHSAYVNEFKVVFLEDHNSSLDFSLVMKTLIERLEQYKVYEYNTTDTGRKDIEELEIDDHVNYKIYVGGNMLGRGVTFTNLCVTYMYRDSKVSAIDTLYQRARWLGYKRGYFDICRVYMTLDLKEKFVAIADSERDLWNSVNEFLTTKIDLSEFKRIFSLPHDKLILTRKSVSKTITFERIKPGYTYDKSVLFDKDEINENIRLVNELIETYKSDLKEVSFALGDYQNHLLIEDKFTKIYESFISNYIFQRNSSLGPNSFKKILQQVESGQIQNNLVVVIMRYKTGQYRALSLQGHSIKELPQGYDPGSGYPGDKNLTGLENKLHLQVHLVYTDKNSSEFKIPILAFSNPITRHSIRYATGDAFYDYL
ncbi:MAG: Z1 domain-containing protein [Acholeplasma sp.]|nr:Z1 domain-containing protein [Acholeplasma sp.]